MEEKKITWHTEQRKVNELIPTSGNPRKMTKKQAEDLEESLKKFDLAEIPAINTDNHIVSGHQRLLILKKLGRGEEVIDVRVPNRLLTKEEHKEYLLRANRNLGSWDYELLAMFDRELLTSAGFEEDELSVFFEDFSRTDKGEFEEISKKFTKETGAGEKNEYWFYAEFYQEPEKYKEAVEILGENLKKGGHNIEADFFYQLLKEHKEKNV